MARRFSCHTKVGNDSNGNPLGSNGVITFKTVTNLLRFTEHLDKTYPDWRWFNVYDSKTRNKLISFTKNRRPSAPFI